MSSGTVRFKFDIINDKLLADFFNKSKYLLNFQFDDHSNVVFIEGDVEYRIEDVSNLDFEDIETIANHFFNFIFKDTCNVFLYKFLVLKNNDKFTVLANIHSSIFSYASANDFYELFNDANGSGENGLSQYYDDVKNYLNSSDFDNDFDYWRNIELNAGDYVKFHNLKSNNYKRRRIDIDKEYVLSFIKNQGCGMFNFYACAFSLYLSRINRQKGCLLKTDISSNGVGLKTILKFDLNMDGSFADYLSQFDCVYDDAVSHTKVSLDNFMDDELSYYSIHDFSNLNENISIYNGDDSALTLNIYGDYLEIVYNEDLFSDIYIQHMADNIKSMVRDVVEFPNHLLKDVNILSDNEEKLLSDFCRGEDVDVDDDLLVARYFRRNALENPDAIAIDDGVNQVSYAELEKSTNSIANDLSENYNISRNSHVGVILPRNYHYPEVFLALNKLGAVFIPIDTTYPVKRIEHMLVISQAECIVTTKDIAGKLDLNQDFICIEDLNSTDDADVEIVINSENLFSIMFTSGTTGLPKGVKVSNHQIAGLFESFKKIFSFSPGDIIGCYLSFSFIASYVIFLAFLFGGGCRIFNEKEQKDILSLIGTLKEKPMNSLLLPPTLAVPILESGDIKLDYLVLGGGKLKELSKRERNTQLINLYGTTEIIFGVTKTYDFKDIGNDNLPIGRPVTNTNVYILDKHANQMPIGVPGEICVSSEYISQGYYNNPELTSEVFVDNPYSDGENNRIMYRTGDVGFYNFDGDIEILGREDDQLSVRGFRIESSEILNIVGSIDEIENVYLDAENDTLALYYTTNAEIDINIIKEKLAVELPYYMIPSIFMELDEIPLNMNGKINRARLKKMSKLNSEINIDDSVLAGVVDAFKEILDTDLVFVDDDFVELGGNSLSAMKLQILLKEKFGANLSSNEIMELSTPVNIADALKYYSDNLKEITLNYAFEDLCPLSESQLNVYLDEMVNSMGTAYNNPFKIVFRKDYSVDEIKNALIKLFDAFPVLKARVLNDDEASFVFDGEPEIIEGEVKDIGSFVKPFEFDRYLSRFLIVRDAKSDILCADFHHLIFDGTSLGILLNRLISILNGSNDDSVDNGVLRQISFEEMMDSSYSDDAKEFFDNMLADRDEAYDLLPSVDGSDEFEFIDTFDMDWEHLASFLQSHTITYNQFFASVFGYALSRFTGSNKVLFNMIEDGRGHIDLSESVGMFVKTLPVLMDCENRNVESFLGYSSSLINSIMKYDLYPFRILASDYDLNSNILFQYSHNLFEDMLNKDDLKYDIDELEHDLIADLSFFIFNHGEDKFTIRILYSSLFSESFIEHFVESYKLILQGITEAEELKDITYLSDADFELLDSYNQTEHDLAYADILDAFNDNLSMYPDNTLVSYNDNSYSYGEGAFIADKIARSLVNLGVESQDCVAFLVPRSERYMFSVLGILSMGGVYVPLDDALPDERIKFMLEDTRSKVVIVSDETYERGRNLAEDCIILNISDIIKGEIKSLGKLDVSYGDLACILYTSGSTGLPKGVKITRKSIVNFIHFHVHDLEILRQDVYGLFASIGFDVAMAAIFSAIYSGACMNVIPEDIKLNIKLLNDYIVKYGITHSYITTQVAKLFISEIEETSLKVLVAGGEKLGQIDAVRNCRIVDAYGPTEACVYVISEDTTNKIDHSSVGHVQINTKAYILDKEFRQVPIGAVGELYLSGCQLADGYLNRPEETSKAFSTNPFENNDDYNRLYCTGDVARLLPDGTYGIVGRRDGQIKVRGNRLELTEVEAVIREMGIIDDVTVQIVNINENNELIAYVVSDESDEEHLKGLVCDYVGKHKPDYMIPSFLMKLESIPLNINGKVDKRALPEVDMGSLHAEYVAPRNETEMDIVNAFKKVFNQDKIGVYDDFVHLGGDSLTAIKLLIFLENYNISAADVLNLRTPHAIANNIKEISFDLDVYSLDSGCPLSEPQLNVYLDIMANDKKDAYLLPLFMEIPKKYNVTEIADGLNEMFHVHPILGMCISDEYDVPYLVKGSKPSVFIESDADDEYIVDFLTRPFDLKKNLSRFLILENDDSYSLYAVFHHMIFDALSGNVFKQDLQSVLDGGDIDIDDSFLKVSAFNQQMQKTEDYLEAEEFFNSMLADSDDVGVLLDSVMSDGSGRYLIDLNLDYNLLNSFLETYDVSANVLFSGVFAYTLSRFVGSDKVLFNIVENGRDRFVNYDSIGMFVNTLPLLIDCKSQNVRSFMKYVSDKVYGVMKHNYYPFRLLANKYDIDSNILFQYIPDWIKDTTDIDGNKFNNDLITNMDDLIADLNVDIIQRGNNHSLSVIHSDKYSKDFIGHFIQSYKSILHDILNVNDLSEINYISDSDIELLDSYNQTEHDLDYADVLDAFNDNLSRRPDNPLVSYNDNNYSYGEGAFIADAISRKLLELGVEAQDAVSFLVPRSELYMFCVLAIMSAGGIYVPLDENLPDERIKFILEDSGCNVVIVNDETNERLSNLDCNCHILNISDIMGDDIGSLSHLPVVYGDLACILYTSGTTGVPKGVKITKKSIVNVVEFYVDKYGLTSNDVYGLFSAIGFDVSNFIICAVLYSGCCLSVIPEDIRFNMVEMNNYFIKHNVSHAFITTQVGKLFMQNVDNISLDVLLVAGEKLGDVESPSDYELVDGFGPTEAFAFMSSILNSQKIHESSVGYLNYNMKAYVLDNDGRRVPCGAVGELYLSGYQVADGYLNRREETENAFITNPFDDNPDYDVLYRTGDMVRILPDASLGIVGRRDSQVKIRGNRVELSEVESVIREIGYVEDVTVQTIENMDNNELVAYVVSDKTDDLKESICDYVGERKPDYMVPSFVVKLDEIPLNVNGKVDRHALPEVDIDSLNTEYVAPATETERKIVSAFENVFNRDKIGIYDDFRRLGGDSLTAIRLLGLLGDYNISAADILSLRTPYAIANNITNVSLDLNIYSLDGGCPLNEPQLNVYLDIISNNKTDSYLLPLFMEISNRYDADGLIYALNVMFEVHPILGMCVSNEFDVPYLVKGSKPQIVIESNPDEEYITKFLSEPFDLHDCLCRFLIVENDIGYSLFAVFHHLIFDALSESVFKKDMGTVLDGGSVDVDDSFLKVSAFSQQIQSTDDYNDAEEFFSSMLADSDDAGLLLDSVLPDGPGYSRINLDTDYNKLNSFLQNHNVSENILFSGVFAYALSRFAGSEKALFNIIENGRDRFSNYGSIGMFVNTLPVLVDCKNRDIQSFMEYMSDIIYGVMRHDCYPFRILANEFDVDVDILFQFIPEWIGDVAAFDEFGDEKNGLLSNQNDLIADLTVEVVKKGNDYILDILYSNRYSRDFIDRFIESYKLILHGILNADELSDVSYISDDDVEFLDSYNLTEHDLDYGDVLDAFNDNLARSPDDALVSFRDVSYSYGEGAFIADKIAKRLIDLGVVSGDCVGFLVPRSELYMFSVLGIMSVGAVHVPLDDSHPDERIQFMINDTEAKAVIVSDSTYGRAENLINENIELLNISDIVNSEIGTLSSLPVDYNDLACILYTSGTTGIPKGVKITRKSLVNVVASYSDLYGLASNDVYGLFSNIGFDASNFVIAVVLYSGSSLSVIPEDIRLNMVEMNNYFIRHGVTHAFLTTQVGKLFMQSIDDTSLDVLLVGGEKLGEFESPDGYVLVDGYGPSESFAFMVSADNRDKVDESSVGHLNYNTKVYVLDNENRRVPVGAVGELCISGYQIAEGYLNREEETQEAFTENPFDSNGDYSVLYHTGDMVRVLPDGTLGFAGRRDSQVKIRGNRLELTEVEKVIREIVYVEDVTVQAIKHDTNNELVAYVVVSNDMDGNELKDSICDYVNKYKPDFMVPSFVVKLDEIPLNVNGKVDRRALPDVDMESLHAEYVAPRNENEKEIVKAFEKALGLENVSIYDDFIRLGGDSLIAVKMLNYIGSDNVAMADIFTFRTPEAIAKNMSEFSFDLDIYSLEEGCPLNSAQINVFADVTIYNKRNAYHVAGYIPISKKYSPERILSSLDELLDMHPVLSTYLSERYETNDSDISNLDLLKDLIKTAEKFGIKEIMNIVKKYGVRDVNGLYKMLKTTVKLFKGEYPYLVMGEKPQVSFESNIDRDIVIDFFAESFDLYNYLSKFIVVESEESYYLFYMVHHLIFDAVSAGVLKQDLMILLDGGSIDFDDTFLKSSAFTHQIKNTEKFDEASEFYRPILSNLDDVGILPEENPSSEGYSATSYDLKFDKMAFKSFLRNAGISKNVLFTSVFSYTLSQFTNSNKVIFTMIENGRDRFSENFIGMTSNVMPVVVDCKDQSIRSYLKDVADTVYGVLMHSYYPILLLYQKYNFEVNILFQYVPNWIADDFTEDIVEIGNIDSEEIYNYILNEFGDFLTELLVQVYENGDDYTLFITHSNRYSGKMVEDFANMYMAVLSNFIHSEDSSHLRDALE